MLWVISPILERFGHWIEILTITGRVPSIEKVT